MEITFRGGQHADDSVGPFSFKVRRNADNDKEVITIYKNPKTGKEMILSGETSKQQKQIESLRNEFLTSKGYNPEVDYRGNMGSYKPEYQTILNKSTEKQLRKILNSFWKGYPYKVITDVMVTSILD